MSKKRNKQAYHRALRGAVRVALQQGQDPSEIQLHKQYLPVVADNGKNNPTRKQSGGNNAW
jgi:hypothetical protein